MSAATLGVRPGSFGAVVCVQNGICAFRVDAGTLIREALRVARPGGLVLFSTYAAAFWPHRLQWFELQAAEGLVGEIDYSATRPGEIVCKDGFRSGTLGVPELTQVCRDVGVQPAFVEVDESSVFCELRSAGAV